MGLGRVLEDSVLAVLQVAFLMLVGSQLARRGILDTKASKALSRVVFTTFYPALLFTSIGATITPNEVLSWWPMPVLCVLVCGTGFLMGQLVVWATGGAKRGPGAYFSRGVVAACSLRTSAYVPIIISGSLFGSKGGVQLDPEDTRGCGSEAPDECAVAYIGFYVVFIVLVNWAGMYTYLAGSDYGTAAASQISGKASPTGSLTSRDPAPGGLDEDGARRRDGAGLGKPLLMAAGEGGGGGGGDDDDGQALDAAAPPLSTRDRVLRILNPPMLAIIAALVVGLISPLRRFVFEGGDSMDALVHAFGLLGRCAAPCAILITGASMGRGLPRSPAVRTRDIVAVTVVNLLVTPFIVSSIVYAANEGGVLHRQNSIFKFIMLLETATPTNSNLVIICQLVSGGARKARALATLIFWQYLAALVCLSVWVFVDLYYVFGAP